MISWTSSYKPALIKLKVAFVLTVLLTIIVKSNSVT
jgi:hypothetical protein